MSRSEPLITGTPSHGSDISSENSISWYLKELIHGLLYFWRCYGKSLNPFICWASFFFKLFYGKCFVHLATQNQNRMSSMWKDQWDSMISNSTLSYTHHGGSVPNLLSPNHSESLVTLKKRLSMELLRGWTPDLGSLSGGLNLNLSKVKWPSLVTVCKWKQTLTDKLKKKHSNEGSQVRRI